MHCTHIQYNYLLITNRIVKILVLSIVSLQLAVSKIFSSEFNLFPYITKYILIDMNFVIFNLLLGLQFYMYVLQIVVCPFVLFPLAIVLSVLLRHTDSDYPFGIFKLFLSHNVISSQQLKPRRQIMVDKAIHCTLRTGQQQKTHLLYITVQI